MFRFLQLLSGFAHAFCSRPLLRLETIASSRELVHGKEVATCNRQKSTPASPDARVALSCFILNTGKAMAGNKCLSANYEGED
jgi:hypothetical protein